MIKSNIIPFSSFSRRRRLTIFSLHLLCCCCCGCGATHKQETRNCKNGYVSLFFVLSIGGYDQLLLLLFCYDEHRQHHHRKKIKKKKFVDDDDGGDTIVCVVALLWFRFPPRPPPRKLKMKTITVSRFEKPLHSNIDFFYFCAMRCVYECFILCFNDFLRTKNCETFCFVCARIFVLYNCCCLTFI